MKEVPPKRRYLSTIPQRITNQKLKMDTIHLRSSFTERILNIFQTWGNIYPLPTRGNSKVTNENIH
jgi:hypothetical protein